MKYLVWINLFYNIGSLYLVSLGVYDTNSRLDLEEFIVNNAIKYCNCNNEIGLFDMNTKYWYGLIPLNGPSRMQMDKQMQHTPKEIIYNLVHKNKKLPDEIANIIERF